MYYDQKINLSPSSYFLLSLHFSQTVLKCINNSYKFQNHVDIAVEDVIIILVMIVIILKPREKFQ